MKRANWHGVPGVTFSEESERIMREVRAGKKGADAWDKAEVFDLTQGNFRERGYVRIREWWREEFLHLNAANAWIWEHVRDVSGVRHGYVPLDDGGAWLVYHKGDLCDVLQQWRNVKKSKMRYNEQIWMSTEEAMKLLGVKTPKGVRDSFSAHKIKWLKILGAKGHEKKVWNRKQVLELAEKRKRVREQKVPRGWVPIVDVASKCGISRSAIGRVVKNGIVRAVTVAVGWQKREAMYVEPNAAGKYLATKVQEVQAQLDELIQRVKRATGK